MANTCKNKNCGCRDTGLTTPAPCSCNVVTCPPPEACPETFNDCCIIHMGDSIVDIPINKGDALCVILQKLAIYLRGDENCISPTNDCNSPLNFQTTNITSAAVSLYWDVPSPTFSPVTYLVEYSTDNATWSSVTVSTNTATVLGLLANTKYYTRVTTGCDGAYKCASVTISFTTNALTI